MKPKGKEKPMSDTEFLMEYIHQQMLAGMALLLLVVSTVVILFGWPWEYEIVKVILTMFVGIVYLVGGFVLMKDLTAQRTWDTLAKMRRQ